MGKILERVKGVAALQNNLEVLPVSMFDDRLRLQVARAIYGDPFFIHYADQALPPIHIIVKNGNVTLEGVVASTMDRTKARSGRPPCRAVLLRREQSSDREILTSCLNHPPMPALRKFSAGFFLLRRRRAPDSS